MHSHASQSQLFPMPLRLGYHTHTEHGKARYSLLSLSSKTVYGRLFR